MDSHGFYLMDNKEETVRLEVKTDPEAVREEARWCGVKPGMRVMDAGCGPGLTSSLLLEMARPGGEVVGVDYMEPRIQDAREKYGRQPGIEFLLHDLRRTLPPMEPFDLIWVRFVLEYNLQESLDIVRNLTSCLKPDGLLCLMDLDYNCLNHYPLPEPMDTALQEAMKLFQRNLNFDPYAGRKLYSYLYDLGFRDVVVCMKAHHLIYGNVRPSDLFNWTKKLEVAAVQVRGAFNAYPGGFEGFFSDFNEFFNDPRRFTYTPLILCKGRKPSAGPGIT
ncbi:MAG: methyltransferase type 11 [Deltaproteobacteria bacterium HGW-Deltaproteobacteria-19]|jgi:SAM-dependent methyltransferase|nr:MAG: methyltransferase type 11 [Deltaproteobacteria bacterium HGW-Deltaproteobacteria-19]